MTQVFLIRHAEAEGNLFRRAHGHYDGKNTPNGKLQIDRLENRIGEYLKKGYTIDAIYSSDLSRTMGTAGAVSRTTGLPIIPHAGLREISLGVWEDITWGLCSIEYPKELKEFMNNAHWSVKGSESPADVYDRVSATLNSLLLENPGKSLCIVSHSVAIRALMCYMHGLTVESFSEMPSVDNASISIFNYDGENFTPVVINDSNHIEGLPLLRGDIPDGITHPKHPDLWFRSADPAEDMDLIVEFWRDSWLSVHGDLSAFSSNIVKKDSKRILRANPGAICFAMFGTRSVGILVMDSTDLTEDDAGHISLFAMSADFRGRRFAVQLLGQAISFYRSLGRTGLKLRVHPSNKRAIRFYEKNEFKNYGYDTGTNSDLYIMRRGI